MGRIFDIMCNNITCEELHLASVAGIDDIPCEDLTYDDLIRSVSDYGTD